MPGTLQMLLFGKRKSKIELGSIMLTLVQVNGVSTTVLLEITCNNYFHDFVICVLTNGWIKSEIPAQWKRAIFIKSIIPEGPSK